MANSSTDLRLEDLDLQGYSLDERLHGIALMQDPARADIVRFAAQEIQRLTRENIKLATALGYYAQLSVYEERYEHVPYGSTTAAFPVGAEIYEDGGAIARTALGLTEPEQIDG